MKRPALSPDTADREGYEIKMFTPQVEGAQHLVTYK